MRHSSRISTTVVVVVAATTNTTLTTTLTLTPAAIAVAHTCKRIAAETLCETQNRAHEDAGDESPDKRSFVERKKNRRTTTKTTTIKTTRDLDPNADHPVDVVVGDVTIPRSIILRVTNQILNFFL